jgi:predicted metalloprotease with PDZ domain
VVAFSLDAKGALASEEFAGILGADVLSRCRVGLDYAGAQLILEPGPAFDAPYEFDMCGIRFVMPGERFERLEVFFVFPGSPAAEANIAAGDRVLAIDGRPAASFTREGLRVYMQREGERVTLALEREGKPLTVKFRLRRLV